MSELFVSETHHPYPGLKLPDGTWVSPDIPVETFVLKKAPNSTANFNIIGFGRTACNPIWFINLGHKIERPVRFKGVARPFLGRIGEYHSDWMRVYCLDKIQQDFFLGGRCSFPTDMFWEVMFTTSGLGRMDTRQGSHSKRGRREARHAREFLNENVQVIRLRMYWVLRGIATFERMLFRVRKRLVKRKLFIQATYWGHPECAFSRFSGTINTPVKQRIHAYI